MKKPSYERLNFELILRVDHKSKPYDSFSCSLLSEFEGSRLKNKKKIGDRQTRNRLGSKDLCDDPYNPYILRQTDGRRGLMNSTEHIFFRKIL
jgi:hypothetical protein